MSGMTGEVVRGGRDAVSWRPWALVAFYAVLSAIALAPLLATSVPPLVDYPNHLARVHVLATIGTDPLLRANYAVDWSIRPNLGIDLVLPYVSKVIGPYGAGRLFIGTILLLLVAGTLLLRRALFGTVGFLPVILYLFLYNQILYWGFLNNLFGIALSLIFFASWIIARDKINILFFAAFCLSSCILFFVHFFAFCVYGFSILAFEAWRYRSRPDLAPRPRLREAAVACAQFIPALVLTLLWLADTAGASDGTGIGFIYGTLDWKLVALFSPVLFNVTPAEVIFASVLLLLAGWLAVERAVIIAPAARWPIIGLCVIAVLVPNNISGIDIWAADMRLPPVIAFLFAAAAQVRFEKPIVARAALGVVLGLFVWRIGDVTMAWADMDKALQEYRAALARVEPGASLLTVVDQGAVPPPLEPMAYRRFRNLASLGVIDRSLFAPTQFTGHMTLLPSPRRQPIDSPVGHILERDELITSATVDNDVLASHYSSTTHIQVYWGGWARTFDYVWVLRFDRRGNPVPRHLTPVAEGSYFDIYRVVRPEAQR